MEMSEAQLQTAILEAAQLLRYRRAHFRPAQTGKGYRTPMEGDTGFPDLILARNGSVFAWELKGARGKVAPEQLAWLEALDPAESFTPSIIDARLLRPDDLDAAIAALERGRWA